MGRCIRWDLISSGDEALEQIREIFDAVFERVRSPILGSILIAFAALNWKPIYVLLFSDKVTELKFEYFDDHTSTFTLLILPIVVGTLLGCASPWIRLAGAYVAEYPIKQIRNRQDQLVVSLKVDAIKRRLELEQETGKLEELKARNAERAQSIDIAALSLPDLAEAVDSIGVEFLQVLANSGGKATYDPKFNAELVVDFQGEDSVLYSEHRKIGEILEAINLLSEAGCISKSDESAKQALVEVEILPKGYRLSELPPSKSQKRSVASPTKQASKASPKSAAKASSRPAGQAKVSQSKPREK